MADKILNDEELNKKPINSKVDDTDDDGEDGGNGGINVIGRVDSQGNLDLTTPVERRRVLKRTPDYEEEFIDLTRQGGRGR